VVKIYIFTTNAHLALAIRHTLFNNIERSRVFRFKN